MHLRLAAALAIAIGTPAAAHSADFSNPYDEGRPEGLRFAHLESTMPRDPLLWSSDPGWEPHHTPQRLLEDAAARIGRSLPIGTNAEDAAMILHNAGAHCGRASGTGSARAELTCTFRDVKYRDGGDYTDNVTWKVTMPLHDGRVNGLSVVRDWNRR